MRPYVRRWPDSRSWAFTVIVGGHWWGLCKAGDKVYLDFGRWRIGRRDDWTPLFTDVRRFGPIQWWTSRSWSRA